MANAWNGIFFYSTITAHDCNFFNGNFSLKLAYMTETPSKTSAYAGVCQRYRIHFYCAIDKHALVCRSESNYSKRKRKKTRWSWSATTLMPTKSLLIDFWFSCEIISHISFTDRAIKQSNYMTNDKITWDWFDVADYCYYHRWFYSFDVNDTPSSYCRLGRNAARAS